VCHLVYIQGTKSHINEHKTELSFGQETLFGKKLVDWGRYRIPPRHHKEDCSSWFMNVQAAPIGSHPKGSSYDIHVTLHLCNCHSLLNACPQDSNLYKNRKRRVGPFHSRPWVKSFSSIKKSCSWLWSQYRPFKVPVPELGSYQRNIQRATLDERETIFEAS